MSDTTENSIEKTDAEWREQLTPEQYEVLRRQGTEPAFSGEYNFKKASGMYTCAACGSELFSSRQSSNRAPVGPASLSPRWPRPSSCALTTAMG